LTTEQLVWTFVRASAARVAEILDTLVSLGQAWRLERERYIASRRLEAKDSISSGGDFTWTRSPWSTSAPSKAD
jgi:hypothetical protein